MTSLAGLGGCCPAIAGGGGAQAQEWTLNLRTTVPIPVAADGPYTVNGYTWDALGVANAASFEFGLAGCDIEATGGAIRNYDGGIFDASPRILLDLATQLPELTNNIRGVLEIWAEWGELNFPNNSNSAYAGLSGRSVGQFANVAVGSGHRRNSGANYPQGQNTNQYAIGSNSTRPGDCTVVRFVTDTVAMHYSGVMDGDDWPTVLSPIGRSETTTFVITSSLLARRDAPGLPTLYYALNTGVSTAGNLRAVLRRLLVRLYAP